MLIYFLESFLTSIMEKLPLRVVTLKKASCACFLGYRIASVATQNRSQVMLWLKTLVKSSFCILRKIFLELIFRRFHYKALIFFFQVLWATLIHLWILDSPCNRQQRRQGRTTSLMRRRGFFVTVSSAVAARFAASEAAASSFFIKTNSFAFFLN